MNLVFSAALKVREQARRFGHGIIIINENEKMVEKLPEKGARLRTAFMAMYPPLQVIDNNSPSFPVQLTERLGRDAPVRLWAIGWQIFSDKKRTTRNSAGDHKLFDRGEFAVSPDLHIQVSDRAHGTQGFTE